MIVRSLESLLGTKAEKHGVKWHSIRLLHAEDGIGVTLADGILEAGFDMVLWQKNHLETCYCIEGEGTIEELANGTRHPIKPGTVYAMNDHDRHRIRITKRTRVICTFVPALTGEETHDADSSL
ncbi:MAG: ectoine synthase [Marivivens sp.]|nr:ectoine synthase [Marivivens sp.]